MSIDALRTAYSGMWAADRAIDVTANNVANASTPGYRAQRVELVTQTDFARFTAGVAVASVTRARADLLDAVTRTAMGAASGAATSADLFAQVEAVLGGPADPIGGALDALWASFDQLASDPSNLAARNATLAAIDVVTSQIRHTANGLGSLASNMVDDIGTSLDEVNRALQELGAIEHQLSTSPAPTTSGLLDRREALLDRLAELVGATAEGAPGDTHVLAGSMTLLKGDRVLPIGYDGATGQLRSSTGATVSVGGELGARHRFASFDLDAITNAFDTWATELGTALNSVHAGGWYDDANQGTDLVSFDPTRAAATLTRSLTDPAQLAVSGTPGPPFPTHNGDNARALFGLRTTLHANGATTSLPEALRGVIADAATRSRAARDAADLHLGLADRARADRADRVGVDVDREMVNLLTYQRAYQAAARVIGAADEMLDTLINRTGTVGR